MYRVSPFIARYAMALLAGAALATLWVNLHPASYYDLIEWRLLPAVPEGLPRALQGLTPQIIVSDGLMAFFLFFIGKELWEALLLERGGFAGRAGVLPIGMTLGGVAGAAGGWLILSALFQTAEEATLGMGWSVPLAGDVVLAFVFGRAVFGASHPALHLLLLVTIAGDVLGLVLSGVNASGLSVQLLWLLLPLAASVAVWRLYGRPLPASASEQARRRSLSLWPYVLAGAVSWLGVAASGLPPALGLLPVVPAISHADRSFGLFAEAEIFLHDPLNRLAHLLIRPLVGVLFLFGLLRGGLDLYAFAPTTGIVLGAMWLGKPLGMLAGAGVALALLRGAALPAGIGFRDLCLVCLLAGMGVTIPLLAIDWALPGGAVQEAARLGLALSLCAGPLALGLARLLRRSV